MIIDRDGSGRIIDDKAVFDLDTPDPGDSVDNVSALAVHAFGFGRSLNKAETSSVSICPWYLILGWVQVFNLSSLIF